MRPDHGCVGCYRGPQYTLKRGLMSKGDGTSAERDDETLDENDFSNGVRGKYAKDYAAGSNIVVLAPDVARIFPDSQSVNEALRTLVRIARQGAGKASA